ncbi:MAG TPA: response regulator transcription factor [Verrucomicrobiae bacterium]|nr:response regulator transcription factor [Verrucomicrobiae bacterium]
MSKTPSKTQVLVVDDHPMVRDWLAQMIKREPDLAVCGEAGDAAGALEAIATLKPDMAIVDLTMKDSQGTELIREIGQRFKELPVLVLSMHDESLYAERAIRAGARGYITKQEAGQKIRDAIRCVLNGQIYLSEALASKMIRAIAAGPSNTTALPVDSLSERQLEILRLIGNGTSTKQIAEKLHLSVKTVEGYIARIKEKLDLATANELLQYAIKFNKAVGD